MPLKQKKKQRKKKSVLLHGLTVIQGDTWHTCMCVRVCGGRLFALCAGWYRVWSTIHDRQTRLCIFCCDYLVRTVVVAWRSFEQKATKHTHTHTHTHTKKGKKEKKKKKKKNTNPIQALRSMDWFFFVWSDRMILRLLVFRTSHVWIVFFIHSCLSLLFPSFIFAKNGKVNGPAWLLARRPPPPCSFALPADALSLSPFHTHYTHPLLRISGSAGAAFFLGCADFPCWPAPRPRGGILIQKTQNEYWLLLEMELWKVKKFGTKARTNGGRGKIKKIPKTRREKKRVAETRTTNKRHIEKKGALETWFDCGVWGGKNQHDYKRTQQVKETCSAKWTVAIDAQTHSLSNANNGGFIRLSACAKRALPELASLIHDRAKKATSVPATPSAQFTNNTRTHTNKQTKKHTTNNERALKGVVCFGR